ncbi:MAG: transposase [Deltaproteobacteria bacterium]|nr:transposase [Deltaproteobacteria bacterium]
MLKSVRAPVTALSTGHVPLDIDVFPMDNSNTKKQGVSRTYKGVYGYAPIAAYLGEEGFCVGLDLREGNRHGQKEFVPFLEKVVGRARRLTKKKLLLRMDAAHCSRSNLVLPGERIIRLYETHAISEQFHSEIKTDLDMERLPSGKFATNALALTCAGMAYNMLRLVGQMGLLGDKSPVRHPPRRRHLHQVGPKRNYRKDVTQADSRLRGNDGLRGAFHFFSLKAFFGFFIFPWLASLLPCHLQNPRGIQ